MFNAPINLVEEGKWLLGVSSFECTNTVFNITNENISFSITIPCHWETKSDEKTVDELNKLLELRSLELHVKEVRKRSHQIIFGNKDCNLSDFDTFKGEILEELKNAQYKDLEDVVYRFQLTYDEIVDILDLKDIPTKITVYSLNPGIYKIVDLNITLRYIFPNNVKVNITIDDIRLKSNLKSNQTLIFTEKSFFLTEFWDPPIHFLIL